MRRKEKRRFQWDKLSHKHDNHMLALLRSLRQRCCYRCDILRLCERERERERERSVLLRRTLRVRKATRARKRQEGCGHCHSQHTVLCVYCARLPGPLQMHNQRRRHALLGNSVHNGTRTKACGFTLPGNHAASSRICYRRSLFFNWNPAPALPPEPLALS